MKSASEFDYILINDKLEDAKKEARKTVCNYLEGKDLNSAEKT